MLKENFKKIVREAIKKAQKNKRLPSFNIPEIEVFRPKNENYGDWSTNISARISKVVHKSSLEVSGIIADELSRLKEFEKVETVKPVFINITEKKQNIQQGLINILKQNKKYGDSTVGKNKKVHLDFVSANPTGPIHIGNARGGPYGDILANILEKSGYNVFREYYLNDVGNQINILGHSVLKDEKAEYKGNYIDKLHKKNKTKDYQKAGEDSAKVILKEIIKPSMKKLGISFDNWFSEKNMQRSGKVDKTIENLRNKKLVYEKDKALWFRSTKFGDDKDRAVVKSDGQKTYFGSDISYHLDKLERGYDKLIDIWGADHHGAVKRMKGALKALGYQDKLDVLLTQLVRVIKGGQEIKMSKRAGTYISIDDLLNEVGKDAVRFIFSMYSPDTHINFDVDLSQEKSDKNPVYYVQYAYARIHGILEKAINFKSKALDKFQTSEAKLLNHKTELSLIKELIKFPDLILEITKDYQVQRLPHYALNLASLFHKFYKECRVINSDKKLTNARLNLIIATKIILKNSLDLLGISAPERM